MRKQFMYALFSFLLPSALLAQSIATQIAEIPKDAQLNVLVTDMKNTPRENEIVIFKSEKGGREYQGVTDASGKFSTRVPTGDKYTYTVLGFQDSLSKNEIDIPAVVLKDNKYTRYSYKVAIQFEPPASFVIDGCTFETGKAALKPEAYPVLDELVEYLKRKDDEKIEVGGHTDNVGKAEANMILSTNRANTVRDYLLSKGIAAERVTSKGYGMTVPIAENDTAEGRGLNRRTEVKVL
jgi:outer membrane protein OmpA-like peptidoglycan-associated protein